MRFVVIVIGMCVVVLVEVFYVVVVIDVDCFDGMSIFWVLKVVVEWIIVFRLCGLVILLRVIMSLLW